MKLTILPGLLAALFLFSCDDAPELEPVNTLGTDVQFSMAEYFEPGARTLSFKFLTQKDFPCINYRIQSEYRREGQEIHISLSDVEGADVCLEAIAPASTFLDLGELANGDYPMVIQVGESLVNTGTLTVSDEAFGLTMNEEQGLIVTTPRVLRIPEGVIWGQASHTSEATGAGVGQYLVSRLQEVGATPQRLPEGNYGYFTVDASGTTTSSTAPSESLFLLEYQGDIEAITPLVKETAGLFSGASISLRTAEGDELKSWALR